MNAMTAMEMYQRDARFRAQVLAAVARAVDEARDKIDPNNIRMRDVHDIATTAAMNALKFVLEDDAELVAARFERDHYKKIAEQTLLATPTPIVLQTLPDAPTNEKA